MFTSIFDHTVHFNSVNTVRLFIFLKNIRSTLFEPIPDLSTKESSKKEIIAMTQMKSRKPTTFQLICDEPWFSFIRQGIKPVEGRKNSPKYQKIQPGDFIEFINGTDKFLSLVTEIRSYVSLEEYLYDVTPSKALPGVSTLKEAINIYLPWSTPEDIQKHGFLGIFIKPL